MASEFEVYNQQIVRNNRIFAILYFIFQVLFCFLYGFLVSPQSNSSNSIQLFIVTGTAILVLIGFGLVFSYLRNNSLSGFGFTFLITALVFQYYFLISGFWSKAAISDTSSERFDLKSINIFLSQADGGITTNTHSAVQAFKCALSISVAFSAVTGRAGPLQAFFMVMIGTIFYQLNKQLISRISLDIGGSVSIFLFGGLFGTMFSLLLRCRQKSDASENPSFTSSRTSAQLGLMGALFCWVFFPFLAADLPYNLNLNNYGTVNMFLGVSSGVIGSVSLSAIIYSRMRVKDVIYGVIAGGVISATASNFAFHSVGLTLIGLIGGMLQVLLNIAEQKLAVDSKFSNNAFFLFGVQGFLGGVAGVCLRAIAGNTNQPSPYQFSESGFQFIGILITIGLSIVGGVLTGLFGMAVNGQFKQSYFQDKTYWIKEDDGISDITPIENEYAQEGTKSEVQIKGSHAYL